MLPCNAFFYAVSSPFFVQQAAVDNGARKCTLIGALLVGLVPPCVVYQIFFSSACYYWLNSLDTKGRCGDLGFSVVPLVPLLAKTAKLLSVLQIRSKQQYQG